MLLYFPLTWNEKILQLSFILWQNVIGLIYEITLSGENKMNSFISMIY